ncbi:MAG: head GIN domain-containing protein [Candidatus Kapaibacteriota bacterium]|jgi:hypothetical protein
MIRKILFAGLFISGVILFAFKNNHDGWWGWGKKGSGVERTEIREASKFIGIDVGGAFDVEVVCGKEPAIEITADDNLLEDITTTVRGNTLYIETKQNISPKTKLRLRIATQNLEDVQSSGASDLIIKGVNNDKLSISTSGAGSVKASVKTGKLSVETSGAGNVDISGSANTLDVETSGAAEIKARDLQVKNARIEVSGAGDVEVRVSEELNVSVSGAGDIRYYGNPKTVSKEVSGAGSVSKKGD